MALWKRWENSKTRGKGVCLGFCANHVRCDKNLDKDGQFDVCLEDRGNSGLSPGWDCITGDGKSQDAAQVSGEELE